MAFYWVKTWWGVKQLFRRYVWSIPREEKTVYLTFDDGPIPEVTPWVLSVLKQYNVKATFFCIGDNINKHPDTFKQILAAGHAIGNHTYNHLDGWSVDYNMYLANTALCDKAIKKHKREGTKLFRPPYGKISRAKATALRQQGYKLIMWDVLSADFDRLITPERCLKNVVRNTRNGSIIIFHDSLKAQRNLQQALPRAIEYLKSERFRFEVLPG